MTGVQTCALPISSGVHYFDPASTIRQDYAAIDASGAGLSTIEAIGLALGAIEGKPEIDAGLREGFATMLAKYREAVETGAITPQAPKAGGDRRRKWRGK